MPPITRKPAFGFVSRDACISGQPDSPWRTPEDTLFSCAKPTEDLRLLRESASLPISNQMHAYLFVTLFRDWRFVAKSPGDLPAILNPADRRGSRTPQRNVRSEASGCRPMSSTARFDIPAIKD